MSKTIASRMRVENFSRIHADLFHQRTESGTFLVKGMPVFRSGTFKDSMGSQNTWEVEHLETMVSNFKNLKGKNILAHIPVRDGHKSLFGGSGRVVGYVTDVYLGGKDAKGNTLLLADYEITEPDAVEKIERGTFRARSSEIGFYETNDEALYWPVFQGFAFVDIPAVEGLFSKSSDDLDFLPTHDDEEAPMGTKNHSAAEGPVEDQEPVGEPAEEASAADEASAEESEESEASEPSAEEPSASGDDEGDDEGSQDFSAPGGGIRLFGTPTTDLAAVQRHIDNLESLNGDFVRASRDQFIDGLANSNIIPATQVDAMKAHARSLTVEQYESFQSVYKDAAPNSLFANHADGVTNSEGSEGTTPTERTEIDTLRERVEFARKSGISQADLENMESYKRLQALETQPA